MTHHHLHNKEFMIGAVVGSLLGGVAALLVAPKAGDDLRENICDAYCEMSDRAQDLTNRGRKLAKNIHSQTYDWTDKARCAVEGARKTVRGWMGEEEEDGTKELLIGALIGGVLGATVGLLLAPKSGEDLRRDLMDTYEDVSERTQDFAEDMTKKGRAFAKTARSKTNKWLDLATNIVNDLREEGSVRGENVVEQIKGLVNNKRLNDVLDWAQLGYTVWQGTKSRKR